ncbi:hypothetical protein LEP1GSC104_3046 [Leptospira interrogans str. UI 12621]|uniref:Uncharacterized protein n=1 Tax=Leptospira interrogans str. UI 12621 TaxID=1049937 RepID=A0A0F6HDJ3_LEPIR|nr:hypothetical protein LEP1GSC104_3046 [Leptospira interrogans str. UI 12621]
MSFFERSKTQSGKLNEYLSKNPYSGIVLLSLKSRMFCFQKLWEL